MSHVVSVHVGCCCGACWNQALAEYREAKPVRLVFLYVRQIFFFSFFFFTFLLAELTDMCTHEDECPHDILLSIGVGGTKISDVKQK